MMMDMNGPDIQAVHEVKAIIPESVNVLKNYKKRMPSRWKILSFLLLGSLIFAWIFLIP